MVKVAGISGRRRERWKSLVSDRQSTNMQKAKWAQASARIYIEPQMDETFQGAYAEAIKTGIKRGAFTFEGGCGSLARQILWQVR